MQTSYSQSTSPSPSGPLGAFLIAAGVLLGTALAILLGERWLDWVAVQQSGPMGGVPSSSVATDYLIGVAWAVTLGAGILVWGSWVEFQRPLILLWIGKVFIALGPMLLYDYTYGVDPDGYFHRASLPGSEWPGLRIGSGTLNIQAMTWLHFTWISSSYNASRLSFALVGLVGVFLTYRAATLCTGREDPRIFYAFGLMPSILFWSSTLGKDSLSLFAVAAYVYGVVAWHALGKARYLLWVATGILVGVYIRPWLGPIMLIPLTALGLMKAASYARRAAFVALGVVGIIAAPAVVQTSFNFDLTQKDELLDTTDRVSRSFNDGGSSIEVPPLATYTDLGAHAPLGIFTVLFRPIFGEVPNLFGLLAGAENALLLFLAVRAASRTKWRELKEPLVAWALATVLLWASIYAIGSFQNLGTVSRHRLQIMPLFLGLLLYLGRSRSVGLAQLAWNGIRIRKRPVWS